MDGGGGRAKVGGVVLEDGCKIRGTSTVLTTGTFLRGVIHMGRKTWSAGRIGDAASNLSSTFQRFGIKYGRLKTGTPPRLSLKSLDVSRLSVQQGDQPPQPFSFRSSIIFQSPYPEL